MDFCKFYDHENKIVLLGDSMTDSLLGSFKDTFKEKKIFNNTYVI